MGGGIGPLPTPTISNGLRNSGRATVTVALPRVPGRLCLGEKHTVVAVHDVVSGELVMRGSLNPCSTQGPQPDEGSHTSLLSILFGRSLCVLTVEHQEGRRVVAGKSELVDDLTDARFLFDLLGHEPLQDGIRG